MATLITMPKLSDTMEEGGIFSWLVKEGDRLEEGDSFVEIETDKATMEYPSPEEGYLLKILVQKGEQAPLGAPIAVMGQSLSESFSLDELQGNAPSAVESLPDNVTPIPIAPIKPIPSEEEPDEVSKEERKKISPLAKKLAKDAGLSLKGLTGSGIGGRIVKRDIEQALEAKNTSSTLPRLAAKKHPLSIMRKSIAKNLTQSKQQIPHFYLTTHAQVNKLISLRGKLFSYCEQNKITDETTQKPWKVSFNDLFVFATSRALKNHPALRSSWNGDHILEHTDIHLSVAVALEEGLITPVLHNAHQQGLIEMSQNLRALITKAQGPRRGELDLSSGVFTLSNLGMSCVDEFSAVINPPQSAILAIGSIQEVPRFQEGELISVSEVKLTLSCDHRVVDGLVGARFLDTLVAFLQEPMLMLS